MVYIIMIIAGYLFGCIQTSFLIGKFFLKKDIREYGNGNAGASNATMNFGKKIGLAVVLADSLKAVILLLLIRVIWLDEVSPTQLQNYLYLGGIMVIVGHNYPFYMKFKGGKGTAALLGLLFGLNGWLGLVGLVTIVLVTYVTDYIVLGTLSLVGVYVVYTLLFHPSVLTLTIACMTAMMSLYKHYPNFIAIKNGTETRVKSVLFKKK